MLELGIYLVKASAILALFWLVFLLFLKRETLYRWNRWYLLFGLIAAIVFPLTPFKETVVLSLNPITPQSDIPAAIFPDQPVTGIPINAFLIGIYLLGIGIGLLMIGRQLWFIYKLTQSLPGQREGRFQYFTDRNLKGPFSFFNCIFYNPERHTPSELPVILEHERAHASQFHTLDILLGRLVGIVLWVNPLIFWYRQLIVQNLEYLADAQAVHQSTSLRDYQYALLKISGNHPAPALTHPFYNSFLKNRILMLQQPQSKGIQKMKHLIILPVLALFLTAFNTETEYRIASPASEITNPFIAELQLVLDKDTTDKELLELKEKLAEDGIDFSYTTVRNETGEIIGINLHLAGKNSNGKSFSGSYNSEDTDPIAPIFVNFDDTSSSVSFSALAESDKLLHFDEPANHSFIWVPEDEDSDSKISGDFTIVLDTIAIDTVPGKFVFYGKKDPSKTQIIRIKQEGKPAKPEKPRKTPKTLKVKKENSYVVHYDTLVVKTRSSVKPGSVIWHAEDEGENLEVKVLENEGTKTVIVTRPDGEVDASEEVISIEIEEIESDEAKKSNVHAYFIESENNDKDVPAVHSKSMTYVVTDDAEKNKPLFFIDGKKATEKAVKELDPETIEKMEVLKGDKAIDEYGKAAESGVILITTKKPKN
jgi:beta-lactamase regulating signal transducer with metallopeptidase domain